MVRYMYMDYYIFNFRTIIIEKNMSGTGIEPMSPAWKANMLTTTPTARFR